MNVLYYQPTSIQNPKKFRTNHHEIVALDRVNLEVESDEVYGLPQASGLSRGETPFSYLDCGLNAILNLPVWDNSSLCEFNYFEIVVMKLIVLGE